MKSEIATTVVGCVLLGVFSSFVYYGFAIGSGYSPREAVGVAVSLAFAPIVLFAALFAVLRLPPVYRFLRRHLAEAEVSPQPIKTRPSPFVPRRTRSRSKLRVAIGQSLRAMGLVFIALVPAALLLSLESGPTGLMFAVRGMSGMAFVAGPCLLLSGLCFWFAERAEYPPS